MGMGHSQGREPAASSARARRAPSLTRPIPVYPKVQGYSCRKGGREGQRKEEGVNESGQPPRLGRPTHPRVLRGFYRFIYMVKNPVAKPTPFPADPLITYHS